MGSTAVAKQCTWLPHATAPLELGFHAQIKVAKSCWLWHSREVAAA